MTKVALYEGRICEDLKATASQIYHRQTHEHGLTGLFWPYTMDTVKCSKGLIENGFEMADQAYILSQISHLAHCRCYHKTRRGNENLPFHYTSLTQCHEHEKIVPMLIVVSQTCLTTLNQQT